MGNHPAVQLQPAQLQPRQSSRAELAHQSMALGTRRSTDATILLTLSKTSCDTPSFQTPHAHGPCWRSCY